MTLWTFFELRDGHILVEAPKSALRHAFGIKDPLLGRNETERVLLRTLFDIYTSHCKYKSTKISMFRAFVCHGLNTNNLTTWLHCVVYELRKEHYYPNAFIGIILIIKVPLMVIKMAIKITKSQKWLRTIFVYITTTG